jgi:uncharacterized protein YkwD
LGLIDRLRQLLGRPPRPVPVPPPPPPPGPRPVLPTSAEVLVELNRARVRFFLPPLVTLPEADAFAASWARQQAADMTEGHGAGADGFPERFRRAFPGRVGKENVHKGPMTALAVVADWMDSAPHRSAILGNFSACGVGVALDTLNVTYWSAVFL